ncbi:hypothetical protein Goari_002633, partial [Gossypium aridum]|nr:hypothetical protein [Gossypium aridum]
DKVEGSDSVSWKDLLVSNSNPDSRRSVAPFGADADEDLDLLEGDIKKLFKRKILLEIWEIFGSVAKLDMNIDSRGRGRFARMAIYVSLDKPLVFQASSPVSMSMNLMMVDECSGETSGSYGPWMLVERSPRRKMKDSRMVGVRNLVIKSEGSKFNVLISLGKEMYETVDGDKGLSGTRSGPSGQLEKLDRVVIRSLGPKWVITLMSKRGKDTLYVVKAGRNHQAQLVDVEEIAGKNYPVRLAKVGILFRVLGMVQGKNQGLVDT